MAIEVFSDLSERLKYNTPGFPLLARKNELRNYPRYTAACHWHPDLEFILVLDGSMEYFVNNRVVHMETGEGIFVNSKRLHYNFSRNNTDCTFLVVVVHPALIGDDTHTGKEYIKSKFGTDTEDYILLTSGIEWQNGVLMTISRIYDEMRGDLPNPLSVISQIASICACIGDNIKYSPSHNTEERSMVAIWSMTAFIQKSYDRKITLDDIAAAGSVCRSRCCQLFGKYAGQTPGAYLTRHRINKSCEMLKETNMPVVEVSMACGFQSPSYFTYIFQKEIGTTPREYRNRFNGD
jgi:AraC-like DNA-binding protein